MRIKIGGNDVDLTVDGVRRAVSAAQPESIRDHFVEVDGRSFPVKQAIEVATGIDRSDFTTHQARSLLRRLGFSLGRGERNSVGESAVPYRASDVAHDESEDRWAALRSGVVVAEGPSPQSLVQQLRARGERADQIARVGGRPGPSEIIGADL